MKRAEVAKTRKLFRDLPGQERVAIIKRRREIGRQLLERQFRRRRRARRACG